MLFIHERMGTRNLVNSNAIAGAHYWLTGGEILNLMSMNMYEGIKHTLSKTHLCYPA